MRFSCLIKEPVELGERSFSAVQGSEHIEIQHRDDRIVGADAAQDHFQNIELRVPSHGVSAILQNLNALDDRFHETHHMRRSRWPKNQPVLRSAL